MEQQENKFTKKVYFSLSDSGYDDWSRYAYGYKQAAIILISGIEKTTNTFDYQNLTFPVFFLYRHFTELILKQIIIDFAKLKKDNIHFPSTHNLAILWNKAKPIINELFFDKNAGYLLHKRTNFTVKDVKILETNINSLHKFDKGSFSFRYPIDKHGKNSSKFDFEKSIEQFKGEIHYTFSSLVFVPFMIFHLKYDIFK